jgi:hypothetical protein
MLLRQKINPSKFLVIILGISDAKKEDTVLIID